MIRVENLHKSFGKTPVLRGASFRAEPGKVTALVGPNGAGKTTTLRLLAGLAAPDAGSIMIDGVELTQERERALRRLAFLPQDVRFHPVMTPRQVLRFYAQLRQVPAERVEPLLKEVALADVADRPCEALSGGMRQRLGLALAWLSEAPVLLLDEPGLSLDPDWRAYLKERLGRARDEGATVLMATHLMEIWDDIVDTTLHCAGGAIKPISGGTPAPSCSDTQVSCLL